VRLQHPNTQGPVSPAGNLLLFRIGTRPISDRSAAKNLEPPTGLEPLRLIEPITKKTWFVCTSHSRSFAVANFSLSPPAKTRALNSTPVSVSVDPAIKHSLFGNPENTLIPRRAQMLRPLICVHRRHLRTNTSPAAPPVVLIQSPRTKLILVLSRGKQRWHLTHRRSRAGGRAEWETFAGKNWDPRPHDKTDRPTAQGDSEIRGAAVANKTPKSSSASEYCPPG
jgi:hypothetical protein